MQARILDRKLETFQTYLINHVGHVDSTDVKINLQYKTFIEQLQKYKSLVVLSESEEQYSEWLHNYYSNLEQAQLTKIYHIIIDISHPELSQDSLNEVAKQLMKNEAIVCS